MVEEKLERRLAGMERSLKIMLVLILVSLSCSFAALIIALAVLFIA